VRKTDPPGSGCHDFRKRCRVALSGGAREGKPRPVVQVEEPVDPAGSREYMEKVKLMYDLVRLAFETDSTRSVAMLLDSVNSPAIQMEGIELTDGYHNLSHHGRSESKLSQLKAIDQKHMQFLGNLLGELKAVQEDGRPLATRTERTKEETAIDLWLDSWR
jgi:Protein of unknown function (DUF1552)